MSWSKLFRQCVGLVGALLLAACTAAPPATFDLDPSVQFPQARNHRGQLAVFEPTATLPLESQRVVVRTGPETIAYLHGAQWASDLPSLVQDRLIGGFEAANVLRAVGRPGLLADRSLHTDIQHFEVDVTRKTALVEIYARLVAADGSVVADKTFSATAPAANDHPASIVKALSQAFSQVVHDIVIWAAPRV
jgi:cholesterol transport system auxiliary component